MSKQNSLLPHLSDELPKPDIGRPDPEVWVRELCVFRALKAGPENVVRRIRLRTGLNILWAKPEEITDPVQLNEPGLSGHASGKTTFCRLLRHILGEMHFANEEVTRAIREKFNGGWVLGEVFVSGSLWLVGRPFTLGHHSFCVPNCTIDQFLEENPNRLGFQIYIDVLEKTIIQPITVKTLPTSQKQIEWQHLLQWVCRDQECRLIQLTDWRSKLSKSESPDISVDDQHALMRATVGLLDEAERLELENNSKLVREKQRATDRAPIEREIALNQHRQLEEAVGKSLPTPDSPLLARTVTDETQALIKLKDTEIAAIESDPELERFRKLVEEVVGRTAAAGSQITLLDELLKKLQVRFEMSQREQRQSSNADFRASLKPGTGYCAVPMKEAIANGCTLARTEVTDLGSIQVLKGYEQQGKEINEEIESHGSRKASLLDGLKQFKEEEHVARKQLMERETLLNRSRGQLHTERAGLVNRIALARNAHAAWVRSTELTDRIGGLEKEIETSQTKQASLRVRKESAVRQLSRLYDQVVRGVLGNSVSGSIELGGGYLFVRIERNGDVSSGAIDTIKILAFDLASMAASVAGHGHHPRFLLHDSPREADMAALTYQRFFLWVRQLESLFGQQPCNFQYIITTTEAPPAELRCSPWLLDPVLDASLPEKRLLGVDL